MHAACIRTNTHVRTHTCMLLCVCEHMRVCTYALATPLQSVLRIHVRMYVCVRVRVCTCVFATNLKSALLSAAEALLYLLALDSLRETPPPARTSSISCCRSREHSGSTCKSTHTSDWCWWLGVVGRMRGGGRSCGRRYRLVVGHVVGGKRP